MIEIGDDGEVPGTPVVHQAEGILRARRGITIDEAVRALRAETDAAGLSVIEVAHRIVGSVAVDPASRERGG
ncbi:ANTAR domain-containing protein [Actinomycetospora sp.]|jgi:AmiR/NasT family two-component response regulator|uniref:ANTAR domain-containing protein n=1 Tax=Actinomycetospora sp. TaxID=1872135 RepID=UPI002F3E20FF